MHIRIEENGNLVGEAQNTLTVFPATSKTLPTKGYPRMSQDCILKIWVE